MAEQEKPTFATSADFQTRFTDRADVNLVRQAKTFGFVAEPEPDIPFQKPEYEERSLPVEVREPLPAVEIPRRFTDLIIACTEAIQSELGLSIQVNGLKRGFGRAGDTAYMDVVFLENQDAERISRQEHALHDWFARRVEQDAPHTMARVTSFDPELSYINTIERGNQRGVLSSSNVLTAFRSGLYDPVTQSSQAIYFASALISQMLASLSKETRVGDLDQLRKRDILDEGFDRRVDHWRSYLPENGSEHDRLEQIRREGHELIAHSDSLNADYKGAAIKLSLETDQGPDVICQIGEDANADITTFFTYELLDKVRANFNNKATRFIPEKGRLQLGWYLDPDKWPEHFEGDKRLPDEDVVAEIRRKYEEIQNLLKTKGETYIKVSDQLRTILSEDVFNRFSLRGLFELYRNGTLASYIYGVPTEGQMKFAHAAALAKEDPELFFGDLTGEEINGLFKRTELRVPPKKSGKKKKK